MAKKGKRKWFREISIFLFRVFIIITQLSLLAMCVYRIVPVPLTPFMLFKNNGVDKEWVNMKQISPNLCKAVITSEDPKFLHHFGFDFANIAQSIEDKVEDDKKLRGASTVTQQMVKNLFLWPDRTFIRKGIEAYLTLWVEAFWNKKRIMEVYLNIIETGEGVYGVERAARIYFKKPASALSKQESALIIACLPNPVIYKVNKPSARVLKKQAWISRMWKYSDNPPAKWFK